VTGGPYENSEADEHVSRTICMRVTRECDDVDEKLPLVKRGNRVSSKKGLTGIGGECVKFVEDS